MESTKTGIRGSVPGQDDAQPSALGNEVKSANEKKLNRDSISNPAAQTLKMQKAAEALKAHEARTTEVARNLAQWGGLQPEAIEKFTANRADVSRFHALFCGERPLAVVVRTGYEGKPSVKSVDTARALRMAKPITAATVRSIRKKLQAASEPSALTPDLRTILTQTRKCMLAGTEIVEQIPEEKNPVALANVDVPKLDLVARPREKTNRLLDALKTKFRSPRASHSSQVVAEPPPIEIQNTVVDVHLNAVEIFSSTKRKMLEQYGPALEGAKRKIAQRALNRSPHEKNWITNGSKLNRVALLQYATDELKARIEKDAAYAESKTTVVQFAGGNPIYEEFSVPINGYPSKKFSPDFIVYSQLNEGDQFLVAGGMNLGGGVLNDVGPNYGQEEQTFILCPDLLPLIARTLSGAAEPVRTRSTPYATEESVDGSKPVLIKGTVPILAMPERAARITSRTTEATPDNMFKSRPEDFDPGLVLQRANGSPVSVLCVAAPKVDRGNTQYDETVVADMLVNFASGVKMLDSTKPFRSVAWGAGIFGHRPEMSAAVQILICSVYGIDLTIHGMDESDFRAGQDAANAVLKTVSSDGTWFDFETLVDELVWEADARNWTL